MGAIRPLDIADASELHRLFGVNCPATQQLARELERRDVYLWLGLFADDGQLVATHRAMTLGEMLLLKGVSVASVHRGTTAALRLALAMKEAASGLACKGLAAWIEPQKPERYLAARLGIGGTGLLVHRYLLPLPGARSDSAMDPSGDLVGALQTSSDDEVLVPDLLGGPAGCVNWVIDGRRMVLSGNPCQDSAELPTLLEQLRPLAQKAGADGVEVCLPAADLAAAFSILAPGVTRLSRTPVRMGTSSFQPPGTAKPFMEARA
jgi:hypothetical protein